MDDELKAELLFSSADKYKFLSAGNVLVAGVNDSQEYEDTIEAMGIMGMSEDERTGEGEKGKDKRWREREG